MSLQMSLNACAFQSEGTVVHLSAASGPLSERLGADICLVIDISGSMQLPATVKDREEYSGRRCSQLPSGDPNLDGI